MREQLIGYVLDALDPSERLAVEQQLAENPQWQRELEQVRKDLAALQATREDCDPPKDLAERTCQFVFDWTSSRPVQLAQSALSPGHRSYGPPSSHWSLADTVVAVGICLVVAIMFFPAIFNSRFIAQRLQCQDQLRQLGIALGEYSELAGGGYFPAVPTSGKRSFAGIYGPSLAENGYLRNPRLLICPASRLASEMPNFRIPTLSEIDRADEVSIVVLQRMAGGSYAYSLGVVVNGVHRPPRNLGRPFFVVMADAPLTFSPVEADRLSHGGQGLNLLFEDGHVEFVSAQLPKPKWDDPFHSRRGLVEAGMDEDDAVVGPSIMPPFPFRRPDR